MKIILFTTISALMLLTTSCAPYTWGYESTLPPYAAQAYIQAVMAQNNGDTEAALSWYDLALRYQWSDRVARERELLMHQNH